MEINKYKDWEILEQIPQDWKIDKTAGSPIPKTVFITNGKSVLNGQKRALLKVNVIKNVEISSKVNSYIEPEIKEEKKEAINKPFPSKSVNTLARKKFQEQLLKEIKFDLMVCEIEGWDKKEYIKELRNLINSINISTKLKNKSQLSFLET